MKQNEELSMEIVSLQDLGYMLADNQRDLTLIQKLFLTFAVPMVREKQEKESNNENTNSTSNSLKNRIREKRNSARVDYG